jgi:hypothetical protein
MWGGGTPPHPRFKLGSMGAHPFPRVQAQLPELILFVFYALKCTNITLRNFYLKISYNKL